MDGFSSVGHVFNLGHGIYPDVDPENVVAMISAVRGFSK
jgi:uroporphyrinogen decarboxylase